MFVLNSKGLFANGTISKVVSINYEKGNMQSADVLIGDAIHNIKRMKNPVYGIVLGEIREIGHVENLPFVPAHATTIDKSQGLTLDKIAIVLERESRPNQIYVALSRARTLANIMLFGRKLDRRDIKLSKPLSAFNASLQNRLISVNYKPPMSVCQTDITVTGRPNIMLSKFVLDA